VELPALAPTLAWQWLGRADYRRVLA